MHIYQKPGYHIEQGHLACLFAHLALKIKCVIDVVSLSNIWIGDIFPNNKSAYDWKGQLANTQIWNKKNFFITWRQNEEMMMSIYWSILIFISLSKHQRVTISVLKEIETWKQDWNSFCRKYFNSRHISWILYSKHIWYMIFLRILMDL